MDVECRPTGAGGHIVTVEATDGPVTVRVELTEAGMAESLPIGDGTEVGRMFAHVDRNGMHNRVARLVANAAGAAAAELRAAVNADAEPVRDAENVRTDEAYAGYAGAGGMVVDQPLASWSRL